MIIFNKKFEIKILQNVVKSSSMPISLLNLINKGFIIHSNECVFFKEKQPVDAGDSNGDFFDKTEQECFYNELRVSNYTNVDIESVAVNATLMIIDKLQEAIPLGKFEVITSFDDFGDEIDAVIKLHTLREEDVPYIDIQSLDEYQQPIFISRTE